VLKHLGFSEYPFVGLEGRLTYNPPEIEVLEILKQTSKMKFECKSLVDWQVGRGKNKTNVYLPKID